MKKLAISGAILAFVCRNEIITLIIIAIIGVALVCVLFKAWYESEPKSMEGTFSAEWGKKGVKKRRRR